MGRKPTVPDNAGVTVVPTFAPDPYGLHVFAGALDATTLGLSNGLTPVIDARGSGRWHGWTNGLQHFRGAHAGNVGAGRAVVPTTTRFDQTAGSAVSTPVQQIFEERMAARRFS
jgi:hypothetical protein